ncbi:MAG: CPBP family glutamic-type intramembrane protease [Promethearchaeota archaeon]|jgi:membrane protease YdiL (CAAX protease family)
MYNNSIALFAICLLLFLCGIALIIINYIKRLNTKFLPFQGLVLLIPILFLVNLFLFYQPYTPPFFFGISHLIGLTLTFDLTIFLILTSIILIKLIGIYVYFMKSPTILKEGRGDETFQFFAKNVNFKKMVLLLLLFPLSALVEELIYRSLLLSFFTIYFNLNLIFGIFMISLLFGLVHFSTSKNWGHVISTFVSSIIYFIALINLGLIYSWVFHLITNITVIFFYNSIKKRKRRLLKLQNHYRNRGPSI